MLKNHLLLAIRHLWRNKLYTTINIIGLSTGIAACLVITLLAQFELSFDRFRTDKELIYRVHTKFSGTFEGQNRGVSTAVAPWLEENVSGIAYQAPFFTRSLQVKPLNAQNNSIAEFDERDIAFVTPDYFSVFSDYHWISGDPKTSLTEPYQVVLSDQKARQYFGESNPLDIVGRSIVYQDSIILTVSGLIEAPPKNTDLQFNDFISYSTIPNSGWRNTFTLNDLNSTSSNSQLFIKLLPDANPDDIQQQFAALEHQYAESNAEMGFLAQYTLQPLKNLHFNSAIGIFDNSRSPAHLSTLYILLSIAFLLLIIAAINFVNLETAQSIRRAKEVGVRKVMGSSRWALISQFLGQTLMIAVIAMFFSIMLVRFSFWYFSDFIPEDLTFQPAQPGMILFFIGTTLIVTLLSGLYPAFVLSAFQPVQAIKDSIGSNGQSKASYLRRGLVVFQFVIAQVLIFGTITIGNQIKYLLTTDMGFNKEAIVYFSTPYQDTTNQRFSLGEEIRSLPQVQSLSYHQETPARRGYNTSIMKHRKNGQETSHNVYRKFGDTAYIHLFGIELLAGRNLQPSDSVKEMMINATLAQQLGFQAIDEAIGELIDFNGSMVPIVGIVEDFSVRSLHNPIYPAAIANQRSSFRNIAVKLNPNVMQLSQAIDDLKNRWNKFYPNEEFSYHFLDETIASFYETERKTTKLIRAATLIAIIISCLGLFGLVSFTANQRTKEIGIRKVLGASVSNIVTLLSKEFILLVVVAFVIAVPIAWWGASQWLENYAFSIKLSWWLFALCGILALLVAFFTMSIQAIRAALHDPMQSLKSE